MVTDLVACHHITQVCYITQRWSTDQVCLDVIGPLWAWATLSPLSSMANARECLGGEAQRKQTQKTGLSHSGGSAHLPNGGHQNSKIAVRCRLVHATTDKPYQGLAGCWQGQLLEHKAVCQASAATQTSAL